MSIEWTNVRVKLSALRPWAQNPRHITRKQAERLAESFSEFGQVETVAIGPDGDVYNGHQRLSVLLKLHGSGYEIDARQSSRPLTDDERKKLVVFLHAGAVGGWSWDALSGWEAADLMQWGFDGDTLQAWKGDIAALGNLIESETAELADAEPQFDRAEELQEKWQVRAGDLWRIGEHRLLCGDSNDETMRQRLMDGKQADCFILDPMYDDKPCNQIAVVHWCIENACTVLLFGEIVELYSVMKGLPKPMYDYCWFMPGFGIALGPGQPFRHHRTVVVWRGKVGNDFPHNGPAINPLWDSVINAPRPAKRDMPYQKNQEGIEIFCIAHANKGGIIGDLYLGSGTTLAACARTGRICYGAEIEPKMVAICLERMLDLGLEPILSDAVQSGAGCNSQREGIAANRA